MEGKTKVKRTEVKGKRISSLMGARSFPGGPRSFVLYFLLFTFYFLLSFCLCLSAASAQDPDIREIAPPPLKLLSKEERVQLDSQSDVKKRTKLALELMEVRVRKSEELHKREEFGEMFKELGGFHAIMDNTLDFLNKGGGSTTKVLDNFKRLELGLRAFMPRLELIRRDLPLKYEFYLRNLVKYLRDARTKAVEPFFSDTVVPNKRRT